MTKCPENAKKAEFLRETLGSRSELRIWLLFIIIITILLDGIHRDLEDVFGLKGI